MPFATPPRHVRWRRPSSVESGPSRNSATRRAGVDPVGAVEHAPALGERRQREAVPRGDRLVVARRLRPLVPHLEQLRAQLVVELAADDEAVALEDVQELVRHVAVALPGEREALDAVRVGVLRRGEPAALERELAQHVVDGLLGDLAVALLADDLEAVQVADGEQRVVVEHLLEVRHEPLVVDRVAVEAAADDVVHAAERHLVERRLDQVGDAAPQQELERRRRRELRRVAPAAPLPVERRHQVLHRAVEQPLAQLARVVRRRDLGRAPDVLHQLARRLVDLLAVVVPHAAHGAEHLAERAHALARRRREVRAAEERLAVGLEEDGERPPAAAGDRDDGLHVDRVDVGPLLPVDLDADEVLVHHARRLGRLERLALHHVAPVAGRVADREQDRLVLGAGLREGLLAPRVPVDRVVGVLEEVRAGLVGEAVRHRREVTARSSLPRRGREDARPASVTRLAAGGPVETASALFARVDDERRVVSPWYSGETRRAVARLAGGDVGAMEPVDGGSVGCGEGHLNGSSRGVAFPDPEIATALENEPGAPASSPLPPLRTARGPARGRCGCVSGHVLAGPGGR